MHIVALEQPQQCSVCDSTKILLLTSKLSYLLSTTLPIKLKLRLQIGGRLLIANQPHVPTTTIGQSETGSSSQIIFLFALILQVHNFSVPFTSLRNWCKITPPNPFWSAKPACFDSSSSNFNVPITSWAPLGFCQLKITKKTNSDHQI